MNPNQENPTPQQNATKPEETPAATENEGVQFTEATAPSEQPATPAPPPENMRPMKPWEIEEAMKESGADQSIPQQTMIIGLDEDEKVKREKEKEQTFVTGVVPKEETGPKIVYDSVSNSRLHAHKKKPIRLIVFAAIAVCALIAVFAFAIYNL